MFTFLLLISTYLLASSGHQDLIAHKDINVYASRAKGAEVLSLLEKGDRVPISTRNYGRWSKIRIQIDQVKKYGWVRNSDIKGAKIRSVDRAGGDRAYHRRKGLGVLTNFSYVSLGEEEYRDAGGQTLNIDNLSGANTFFGFYFDYPISTAKQLHIYLAFREHDLSGETKFNANQNLLDIDVEQTYLSLGLSLKNYKNQQAKFWWSYGIEFAQTTDMKYTISNAQAKIEDDLPLHILLPLGFGYDYQVSDNLYFIPNIKLHALFNAGSLAYGVEVLAMLSYAL